MGSYYKKYPISKQVIASTESRKETLNWKDQDKKYNVTLYNLEFICIFGLLSCAVVFKETN